MKKSFNPWLIIICFIFLLAFSCKKDKPPVMTCGVLNPLEELTWLKDKIQGFDQLPAAQEKYIMITQAVYQGQTAFIQSSCDPLGNSFFPIFNCSGEQIGLMGQISPDLISLRSVLWIPVNSACQAND